MQNNAKKNETAKQNGKKQLFSGGNKPQNAIPDGSGEEHRGLL